jgi:hypothetical protein
MFPGNFGVADEDCNCRCSVIAALVDSNGNPIAMYRTPEAKEARWKVFETQRLPHERNMRRRLRSAFTRQEEAALAALKQAANQ